MLINELRLKNLQVTNANATPPNTQVAQTKLKPQESPFAQALKLQLEKNTSGVEFSRHAMERIASREIDLTNGNMLERLNKAVGIAQQKGANETLVLVDETAFVVNIKNNKVITTLSQQDMLGNIFTNIDSTVII